MSLATRRQCGGSHSRTPKSGSATTLGRPAQQRMRQPISLSITPTGHLRYAGWCRSHLHFPMSGGTTSITILHFAHRVAASRLECRVGHWCPPPVQQEGNSKPGRVVENEAGCGASQAPQPGEANGSHNPNRTR